MAWIPVTDNLPNEDLKEWYIVQTQDGSVYPAKYTTIFVGGKPKVDWSPIFRGGTVDALMHGSVAFWQPHDVGYDYVTCRCGRSYLKSPGVDACPLCADIMPKKVEKKVEKVEEPVVEDDFPESDDVLTVEEPIELPKEEPKAEKKPVARKPRTTTKKK